MKLTIKSRREIETIDGTEKPEFVFWMPNDAGYVRLVTPGHPGTMGQQICHGGKLSGNTIYATEKSFERLCRSWYRAYMKNELKYA